MKPIQILLILLLINLPIVTFAQADKFTAAMQKGMKLLDSAKTPEDFIATANHFERIASKETKQWLPVYYAAYANLRAALIIKGNDQKDPLYDKALEDIEKADIIAPNNSEIYTLKGYILFMKMTVSPMTRMSLSNKASEILEKAKKLDPSNPRPYLVIGQNTFYTPEIFGGGPKKAKPILENAWAKYEKYTSGEQFFPSWGKDRCKKLLDKCKD